MVLVVVMLEQISGFGGGLNILNRPTPGKRVSPKVRKAHLAQQTQKATSIRESSA